MKLSELFETKLLEKKSGKTAWVILYTPDKLILGKRAPGVNNPNQWNFFGGHIDDGETAVDAAVRELEEEIKVKLNTSDLKQVAQIGDATYFAARVPAKVGTTTDEVSMIKQFKLTELPQNLHSKTENFFHRLDHLFET